MFWILVTDLAIFVEIFPKFAISELWILKNGCYTRQPYCYDLDPVRMAESSN